MSQPTDAHPTQATTPTPDAAPQQAAPDQRLDPRLDPNYEAEIAAIEDDLLGEIERLQCEAAERERALVAERDAYREQLRFATDTKGWRASTAYWRARERGLAGALDLGRDLGAYLARVGYHLGVPYAVRRDLWYRRNTGKSYRSYFRTLSAAQASAPLDASAAPEHVRKVAGPDVLVFAACAWDASSARQRRLAQLFSRAGQRCRWISPRLTMAQPGIVGEATTRTLAARDAASDFTSDTSVGGDLAEITLPGDGSDVTLKPVFRRTALRHALAALVSACFAQDLREVVCLVQHPGWEPLVEALRRRYGWKVVYDLAESQQAPADARLAAMLAASDLIVMDTPAQRDWLLAQGLADDTRMVALLGDDATADGALSAAVRRLYGRATIIIVTYRNLDKTRLTLKSVLEKTRYPNYEVLLVDNGGEPGIQQYARAMAERFPGVVRAIFNAENLGFAGGNNVGLRAAPESDYVVLLNDDVIVTPGWLGGLLRALDDPTVGLVGPVTNSCGNEARIAIDYNDVAQVDAFARRYTAAHDGASFDIPVLAMYCLALRRETADALGELDERFRMGMFEDDDYAVRAHNAGYRVVCVEDVYVHHFGRSSFSKMSEEAHDRLFAANRALFEQKWGTTWSPHKYREG